MLIKNEFPAIPIIEQIHITSMHSLFKIHYECGFEFLGMLVYFRRGALRFC